MVQEQDGWGRACWLPVRSSAACLLLLLDGHGQPARSRSFAERRRHGSLSQSSVPLSPLHFSRSALVRRLSAMRADVTEQGTRAYHANHFTMQTHQQADDGISLHSSRLGPPAAKRDNMPTHSAPRWYTREKRLMYCPTCSQRALLI